MERDRRRGYCFQNTKSTNMAHNESNSANSESDREREAQDTSSLEKSKEGFILKSRISIFVI